MGLMRKMPFKNGLLDYLCSYSPFSSRAYLKHSGGLFLALVNSEECELLICFGYLVSFRKLILGFLGFFFLL